MLDSSRGWKWHVAHLKAVKLSERHYCVSSNSKQQLLGCENNSHWTMLGIKLKDRSCLETRRTVGNIFDFYTNRLALSHPEPHCQTTKVEVSSKFINDNRNSISRSNRRHHEGRRALEESQECHNLARRPLEITDQPKDTTRQKDSLSRSIDLFLHHLNEALRTY